MLYARISEGSEGELSRLKSIAVSERALMEIAADLGIAELLNLGKGEEFSGGRGKKAILADAVEALIGALSLDSGLAKAFEFVERYFGPHIEALLSGFRKDFKTILQEYAQKQYRSLPEYKIVRSDGPEHMRRFWVECRLRNQSYGPVAGATKKEAETKVAEIACRSIAATDAAGAEVLAAIAGKPISSL